MNKDIINNTAFTLYRGGLRRILERMSGSRRIARLKKHVRLGFEREEGFSLVEVVVAVAILGLSITAFANALSTGSIAVNSQSEQAIALRLAQTQMESIKEAAYDATGASYAAITAPTGYSLSVSVNSEVYANNDIQKVAVTVLRGVSPVMTVEGYKVDR